MATVQPNALVNGAPTALGGDGTFSLDSFLLFQNGNGATRKITVRDALGFLGISVGTEAEVQTGVGTPRSDPMIAFITNGRKTNHVQGAGTFAEGTAAGTGVLAQLQASNTDWESLANGEDVNT